MQHMLARIQDKHPWFWEMKALISEQLNMVPVRVGNNSTPINILLLQKPDTAGLGDGEVICFHDLEDFDSQSEPWTELWTDGLLGGTMVMKGLETKMLKVMLMTRVVVKMAVMEI